jgi:hypothetical protein
VNDEPSGFGPTELAEINTSVYSGKVNAVYENVISTK